MISPESLLRARTTDPATSHIAMSEVRPGKIIHFANVIYEMLKRSGMVWTSDRSAGGNGDESGSGGSRRGLTDWQMTQLIMDVDAPSTGYLDPLRAMYPMTGENNVGGFVRMGRLWLVKNGYVINSGYVRQNKYEDHHGHRYQANRGIVWHRPAGPVVPPVVTEVPCPHCGGTGTMAT